MKGNPSKKHFLYAIAHPFLKGVEVELQQKNSIAKVEVTKRINENFFLDVPTSVLPIHTKFLYISCTYEAFAEKFRFEIGKPKLLLY